MFCLLLNACVCINGKLNLYRKIPRHDFTGESHKGYTIHTKPATLLLINSVPSRARKTATVQQTYWQSKRKKRRGTHAALPVLTFIAVSHSYAKQDKSFQNRNVFTLTRLGLYISPQVRSKKLTLSSSSLSTPVNYSDCTHFIYILRCSGSVWECQIDLLFWWWVKDTERTAPYCSLSLDLFASKKKKKKKTNRIKRPEWKKNKLLIAHQFSVVAIYCI